MSEEVGGRIKEFVLGLGHNMASFSNASGVPQSTLHSVVSGRTKPSYDLLAKLAERFPGLSMDWLLSGRGLMLKKGSDILVSSEAGAPLLGADNDPTCWDLLKREEEQHERLKQDYAALKGLLRQARIDYILVEAKESAAPQREPIGEANLPGGGEN